MAAVPHRLENPHKNIVHDKGNGASEINLEISHGIGEDLLWRPHQNQDLRRQRYSDDCEGNAGDQTESDGGMDGTPDIRKVSGAIEAPDYHSGAHGHAIEKAHQEKDQIP